MPEFDSPIIQKMYEEEQARIDKMRAVLSADGMITLPFHCWGCDKMRWDFFMVTGDGLPMCKECFGQISGDPVEIKV